MIGISDKKILEFIKSCIKSRRIIWTYHVNMRMKSRLILRNDILDSIDNYEIIERYPDDKYLPSYLIFLKSKDLPIHIQVAVDLDGDYVTVVTVYRPESGKWENDFKRRKK